jgi:hypothetical protein
MPRQTYQEQGSILDVSDGNEQVAGREQFLQSLSLTQLPARIPRRQLLEHANLVCHVPQHVLTVHNKSSDRNTSELLIAPRRRLSTSAR